MTHDEDIWDCNECGDLQGRHDMCFDGLCESCNSKKLTPKEQIKLDDLIRRLRNDIKQDNALSNISGGFCTIDMIECDELSITLSAKFGTQNDCGSSVTEEIIELDRETFEIESRFYINESDIVIGEEIYSWEYSVSTSVLWASFDYGQVKAKTYDEALELAKAELNHNFELANKVLATVGKGFKIYFNDSQIELNKVIN